MSKNKNKKHRYEVYIKCNFSCQHCGIIAKVPKNWNKKEALFTINGLFLEIDHIVPISIGGNDTLENKQALCKKCNIKKSNKYVG